MLTLKYIFICRSDGIYLENVRKYWPQNYQKICYFFSSKYTTLHTNAQNKHYRYVKIKALTQEIIHFQRQRGTKYKGVDHSY